MTDQQFIEALRPYVSIMINEWKLRSSVKSNYLRRQRRRFK